MIRALLSLFVLSVLTSCACETTRGLSDAGVDANSDRATIDVVRVDQGPCGVCSGRCFEGQCIADNGECVLSDTCGNDTYCTQGLCVPYGIPADRVSDNTCARTAAIESITPSIQCQWNAPRAGDPFPNHSHVMSTPMVVDFDFDDDPQTLEPSLVFAAYPNGDYGAPGVIRIISGADCSDQFVIDASAKSPAPVAVGDINGDGRPDLVASTADGGLVAYEYRASTSDFVQLFRSGTCSGGGRVSDFPGSDDDEQWAGPSLHDLNDDGVPEILYGRSTLTTYDNDGCVLDQLSLGLYDRGYIPVVADVDEDGAMELVTGSRVYAWSTGNEWVAEPYFTSSPANVRGQVAVADFGNFPIAALSGRDVAEIAVVSNGQGRIQTVTGEVVFGPFAIPGGGVGGAPTVADFDGDGRIEFASAGGTNYVVFDRDCAPGGIAAGCGGATRTDGILWQTASQDSSSNVTGSSVFDFDANGAAEVVYADECFLRVYDGRNGNVLYSQGRSSATTYDSPVIADVDGDFRTEIVVSMTNFTNCPSTDPLRPSSTSRNARGVIVMRDEQDRWASSRPVWNQLAYAVTHVRDDGTLPRTSEVAVNWRTTGLNNFRQNVQGGLSGLGNPDLTTTAVSERLRVACDGTGRATLVGRVCNRGSLPMAAGFEIEFRDGSATGPSLCRTSSETFLAVGQCDEAECEATLPLDRAVDVYVIADPDSNAEECFEGNNFGLQPNVACNTIG